MSKNLYKSKQQNISELEKIFCKVRSFLIKHKLTKKSQCVLVDNAMDIVN